MSIPLSDMSRDALVRELRIATARGDRDRGKRIKRELARRGNPANSRRQDTPRMAAPNWWQRD
jgi:hypothetical protein